MPELGKYAGVVVGSYAATAGLLALLIAVSLWQYGRVRRVLAEVEARQEKTDV